tara:strand:+ start:1786 stop:1971 length:186 start_codon:yes stop_codon:yes gene_type:complete
MSRQTPNSEQSPKEEKQMHVNEYSLDALLSKSPAGSFKLNSEDKQWLSGPIIEGAHSSSDK